MLFKGEDGVGLDSSGRDLPMVDFDVSRVGYQVPQTVVLHSRPKLKSSGSKSAGHLEVTRAKTTMGPSRSVKHKNQHEAPLDADLIMPSELLQLPASRPYMMPPNYMLRMLDSSEMPLSMPKTAHSQPRTSSTAKSRIKKLAWSEWLNDKDDFVAIPNVHTPGTNATQNGDMPMFNKDKEHSTSSQAHDLRSEEHHFDNHKGELLQSVAYSRTRLNSVLSSRGELENYFQQGMTRLGHSIYNLQTDEKRIKRKLYTKVSQERDRLPLKFLFELPNGAEYCRERVQKSMRLWIAEFEYNQQRLSWLQWKAYVELLRYKERNVAYEMQARVKAMKSALVLLLKAMKVEGFTNWIATTQYLIWVDRDRDCRIIQKCARRYAGHRRLLKIHHDGRFNGMLRDMYLEPKRPHVKFEIPICIRTDRREIWAAAIRLQAVYKSRAVRREQSDIRKAATKIQSVGRMRVAKNRYKSMRSSATRLQACVRRYMASLAYFNLKYSAILIQRNYRSMKGRRFFTSIVQARRMAKEIKISATCTLQRIWRGSQARARSATLRKQNEDEYWAALVFQRCWYRYNNEYVTFLLLGCLREQDRDDKKHEAQLKCLDRNTKAKSIQHFFLQFVDQRKNHYALVLQCAWRSHRARSLKLFLRNDKMAKRRLRWWARAHSARRHRIASKLQFWWLHSVQGRFLRHLTKNAKEQQDAKYKHIIQLQYDSATKIQSLVHGAWTRHQVKQVLAAIIIQRIHRGNMGRKIAYNIWINLRIKESIRYTNLVITTSLIKTMQSITSRWYSSAVAIQRIFRGYIRRKHLVLEWMQLYELNQMAIKIQQKWRKNLSRRLAKKLLNKIRRKRINPYKEMQNVRAILKLSIAESKIHYDPYNLESGMGAPSWLHRLAADNLIVSFWNANIRTLDDIRALSEDDLRNKLNVENTQIRARVLAKAHAVEILQQNAATKAKLAKHTNCMQETSTAIKHMELLHSKLLIDLDDAENEFEAISRECADFKRPPKSLRNQLEIANKALSIMDEKVERSNQNLVHNREMIDFLTLEIKKLETQLDVSNVATLEATIAIEKFQFANEVEIANAYLKEFPGQKTRANQFKKSAIVSPITKFQLETFLQQNETFQQVKDNVGKLHKFPKQAEMFKINTDRMLEAVNILQFAAERIVDVSKDGDESESLCSYNIVPNLEVTLANCKKAALSEQPQMLRKDMDTLLLLDNSSSRIQKFWKGRLLHKLHQLATSKNAREALRKAYHDTAKTKSVRATWEIEKKKEAEAYKKWMKEQEHIALLHSLATTLKYNWSAEWKDDAQSYYYINLATSETTWEFPAYKLEEDAAVRQVQKIVRGKLGRNLVQLERRKAAANRARDKLHMNWNTKSEERDRWITVRIEEDAQNTAHTTENIAIALWEASNLDEYSTPMHCKASSLVLPTGTKHCRQILGSVQALYADFVQNYHAFLDTTDLHQCEISSSQFLRQMLNAHIKYEKIASYHAKLVLNLEFTKVAPRFGWQEFWDNATEKNYYFHEPTNAVVWDKPSYTFDEDMATIKMQSIVRMRLGRKAFLSKLHSLDPCDYIINAIRWSAGTGWIGMGLEGLTTAMYLHRNGFSNAVAALPLKLGTKTNAVMSLPPLQELRSISSDILRKAGIPREEDVRLIKAGFKVVPQKHPRSAFVHLNDDDPMQFLASIGNAKKIINLQYPNQPGRAITMIRSIQSSTTPITKAMLLAHLHEFGSKPKLAQEHVDNILNKDTCSSKEAVAKIYEKLFAVSTRVKNFLANCKILYLHSKIVKSIDISICTIGSDSYLLDCHLSILKSFPSLIGIWSHDIFADRQVSLLQAAYILRSYSLETTLQWIQCSIHIQSIIRRFLTRIKYMNMLQNRNDKALILQCCWKQHQAKNMLKLLIAQHASNYEQIWSADVNMYYYFHVPSEESIWEEPIDEFGVPIPYRPLVVDFATGRQIKAWPDLDGATDNKDILRAAKDKLEKAKPQLICSVCKIQPAVRKCNECYSADGDFVYSCFSCYNINHQYGEDMKWHTFTPLNNVEADNIKCVECTRHASRNCFQCAETYCARCYDRIHRRGKRSKHVYQSFAEGCVVCVECEDEPAAKFCDICEDPLCMSCIRITHTKGKKALHSMTEIRQPLSEGQAYCNQCNNRPADENCRHCEHQICQTCLSYHHQVCIQ